MQISLMMYDLLHGNSPVSAIVGTKIEPGFQPNGKTYPFINWEIVGGRFDDDFNTFAGYEVYRVEVHSVAATYTGARDLSVLVRTAMSVIGPQTTGDVYIHRIFLDNETDLFEYQSGYEGAHTVTQYYSIHVKTS
jgi:hypothetical protein